MATTTSVRGQLRHCSRVRPGRRACNRNQRGRGRCRGTCRGAGRLSSQTHTPDRGAAGGRQHGCCRAPLLAAVERAPGPADRRGQPRRRRRHHRNRARRARRTRRLYAACRRQQLRRKSGPRGQAALRHAPRLYAALTPCRRAQCPCRGRCVSRAHREGHYRGGPRAARQTQLRILRASRPATHLAGELFKYLANIDMQHVAYKGAPASMVAVSSGESDLSFAGMSGALPLIRAGSCARSR